MPDAKLPNGNSEGIKKSSNSFSQTTVLTVGYVAVSVVSAMVIARVILQITRPRKLGAEDYCVFLAYAFFVSQCALYIAIAPLSDRVMAVQEGKAAYYPELIHEGILLGKLYFPALLIFWVILWLIKLGLLLLYRRLMVGLPGYYQKIWWSIVVFCGITQVGNIVCYIESCETIDGFFNGGCHDKVRQFMSVWYSYAADTLTNVMSIHALFASALVCIMIATLRAAQITANTIRTDADTDGTWLAVWGMAECAVAVVIGLTPSFAILIRTNRKEIKTSGHDDGEFQLTTIGGSGGTGNKKRALDIWISFDNSQEGLARRQDAASFTADSYDDGSRPGTAI
ncbi:cfem domain-containing protein [Stemphylium lycopersici]|uniref:Cfem domain-containing protein n=1 Tax=Stemphylium lycopersici TaxID=183478 RepID=A0A364N5H0_STELY|nr:cfem domain-containing protein [Stemphylium lycopersici]